MKKVYLNNCISLKRKYTEACEKEAHVCAANSTLKKGALSGGGTQPVSTKIPNVALGRGEQEFCQRGEPQKQVEKG
jgi:hypothetical protein